MHRVAPEHQAFARALRVAPTDAKRALWKHLRSDALQGTRFRRQFPLGIYVADFVCFGKRLVIEVDGGQHSDAQPDRRRDAWLAA